MAGREALTKRVVRCIGTASDTVRRVMARDGELSLDEQLALELLALAQVEAQRADDGRLRAIAELDGADGAWRGRMEAEFDALERDVAERVLVTLERREVVTATAARDGYSRAAD